MALSDHVFHGVGDEYSYAQADRNISILLGKVECYSETSRSVGYGHREFQLSPESFAEFLVALQQYLDRQR